MAWKRMCTAAKKCAKRASRVMLRMLAAAGVTYLYAIWAIEQAYLQRGYRAYGGEYLIIPMVFYMVFKSIMLVEYFGHVVKQRMMSREEEMACRKK